MWTLTLTVPEVLLGREKDGEDDGAGHAEGGVGDTYQYSDISSSLSISDYSHGVLRSILTLLTRSSRSDERWRYCSGLR